MGYIIVNKEGKKDIVDVKIIGIRIIALKFVAEQDTLMILVLNISGMVRTRRTP
jgi:hypothetical protein